MRQKIILQTAQVYNFAISSDLSLSPEASTFELQPFDLVIIRKDPAYEEQLLVEVEGEVIYPGKYTLAKKNERISDILKRAGGLTAFSYTKGATLIRRTEFYKSKGDVETESQQADDGLDDLLGSFGISGLRSGDDMDEEDEVSTDDPDEIRRQRLQELSRRALNTDLDFKTHEFIALI